MYTVAIILINFNTAHLSLQAVDSLKSHTDDFENLDLVVVDNASKVEDFELLKVGLEERQLKNLKLVRSRFNTGFGGGNMLGVQQTNAEFYVFVNSDVLFKEDSINTMISFLKENPEVAMVGAQSEDQKGKKNKPFDHDLSLRKELLSDGLNHLLNPKKFPKRKKTYSSPIEVGAIPGSLMVCRAYDFDAVGGFDTNIFLYYEEKDLAFRIKKAQGKKIFSLPQTSYIHIKGQSTTPSYAVKRELKISQFYTVRKNLGAGKYLIFYTANFLKFAVKAPLSSKNRKHFSFLLKGASMADSLKHQQKINSYQ